MHENQVKLEETILEVKLDSLIESKYLFDQDEHVESKREAIT